MVIGVEWAWAAFWAHSSYYIHCKQAPGVDRLFGDPSVSRLAFTMNTFANPNARAKPSLESNTVSFVSNADSYQDT